MKIGEILVQKGYVTQQQLDGVMAVKGPDAQVGQILIQWGLLTEAQLMEALEIQTPPAPPPPPVQPAQPQGSFLQQQQVQQPMYQQPPQPPQPPVTPPPSGGPDLTMDNIQTSKFKIDLKTMIYIGSLLVSGITMYFTFMSELDSRFAALEGSDKDLMVEIDTRLTELENKFTPIGDGVYSVDPNTTWPPSRGEYSMKQNMNANKITEIEKEIARLIKDLEKLEEDLDDKQDKQ